ncbi:hypothetical protein KY285_016374 [Solanum tuberosum]|nr:hypothetical protein KY284_016366 [Solanum tuberosum]KAH0702096.1 hypothetical protein KY285_016374 [Solanum tuberosum]
MADAEMMEEEKEMKVSGIREKMKEFDFMAYFYQTFNRTESLRWRNPRYSEQLITLAIGITLRPARSTPGTFRCSTGLEMHPRKTEEGSHGLSITDSTDREFHGQPPQKDG